MTVKPLGCVAKIGNTPLIRMTERLKDSTDNHELWPKPQQRFGKKAFWFIPISHKITPRLVYPLHCHELLSRLPLFMEPWLLVHRKTLIAESGQFRHVLAEKDPMIAVCRKYTYSTTRIRTALSMCCIVSCFMNLLSTINAKGLSLSSLTTVSKNVGTVSRPLLNKMMQSCFLLPLQKSDTSEALRLPDIGRLEQEECILCKGVCYIPRR